MHQTSRAKFQEARTRRPRGRSPERQLPTLSVFPGVPSGVGSSAVGTPLVQHHRKTADGSLLDCCSTPGSMAPKRCPCKSQPKVPLSVLLSSCGTEYGAPKWRLSTQFLRLAAQPIPRPQVSPASSSAECHGARTLREAKVRIPAPAHILPLK
jgi:hypothetical protein